jgi:hypothetical protein
LKTVCFEMLTSAARGDAARTLAALERMRAALAAALDVASAIAIAGELLDTGAPSRASGGTAA